MIIVCICALICFIIMHFCQCEMQYGEAEWNKMSERERQRKKMEMRLEERRLRKEGDYETAAALLGEYRLQNISQH